MRIILEEGPASIGRREAILASRLIEGLTGIKGVRIYGPPPGPSRRAVVSLTLDNMDPAEAAAILDSAFGIAVRSGLHCAPLAHKTTGTLHSGGTIRVSPGYFTTDSDIDGCIAAIKELCEA